MYKNEFEIDIVRIVRALFKRLKFILLITILFFIVGCGVTLDIEEDRYGAVATVYAAAENSYSEATAAVTAMNAYLDVAKSYKVSQRAALLMGRSDISAADIQSLVSVNSSAKSKNTTTNFLNSSATIISFVATTNDPDLSMAMADAAAESYAIEMSNILKTDSVKTLDSAHSTYVAYDASRQAWINRIIFGLAGFVIASAVVVLFEIIDRKVRTIREATIRNQLPIIGIIPDDK
ncbi:MAG: hypothetical protein K6F75_05765 [Butyrivibrio sp.]|nr:hypothetical protein [Butyrivibrio sp.]